ncbi:hypothetical protein [Sphingomonas sanxanigenens]|uniref:Uncharacterized protein n=1 Tax=Sphingomonas sanxanigenens DSM 19645 = NX02 TaxID=1123269 RepID=W0AK53_9SPHN|nr:hypothetical protein [Sphingomonas sanxanigenens]AHE56947.1 hypothetical protein NX02_26790 [Sphingomonas sanxanigenens DSM 19645 = NX02]
MSRGLDDAIAALVAAQADLNAGSDQSWPAEAGHPPVRLVEPDYAGARIGVSDMGGGLAVSFRGDPHESWPILQDVLSRQSVADHILLLDLSGPDIGANGLKAWDFASLIAAAPGFPRLVDFRIGLTDPGDHNQSMIADDQLPPLLALMPALRQMELPQAPEPDFFRLPLPDLRAIRTGGDHRTRGFIHHLADATLPSLRFVDFTDSLAPFMMDEQQPAEWSSTPFADYERLFAAPITRQLSGMRLRNAHLTEAQYRALHAARPQLQFSVTLEAPHCYVAHWRENGFPYRHLLPFG